MTSKEYRERLHEVLEQLIFTLQDDRAAALLRELVWRVEQEDIDAA